MKLQLVRDQAIETICSNLLWTGIILPDDTAQFMAQLMRETDLELAQTLVHSRLLLDNYLENCWNFDRVWKLH